jgi:hypothetical protein
MLNMSWIFAVFTLLAGKARVHVILALMTGFACGVIAGQITTLTFVAPTAAIAGTFVLYPILAIFQSWLSGMMGRSSRNLQKDRARRANDPRAIKLWHRCVGGAIFLLVIGVLNPIFHGNLLMMGSAVFAIVLAIPALSRLVLVLRRGRPQTTREFVEAANRPGRAILELPAFPAQSKSAAIND